MKCTVPARVALVIAMRPCRALQRSKGSRGFIAQDVGALVVYLSAALTSFMALSTSFGSTSFVTSTATICIPYCPRLCSTLCQWGQKFSVDASGARFEVGHSKPYIGVAFRGGNFL